MSVIILLLVASITVSAIFLAAFLWSVRSGQFEDEFSISQKILFEEKFQKKNNPSTIYNNSTGKASIEKE